MPASPTRWWAFPDLIPTAFASERSRPRRASTDHVNSHTVRKSQQRQPPHWLVRRILSLDPWRIKKRASKSPIALVTSRRPPALPYFRRPKGLAPDSTNHQ